MKTLLYAILFLSVQALAAQHTVVLKSGTKLECVVLSLNNDIWKVYFEGGEKLIKMQEVSSI
ncbi:MAG: hypothetical protein JKY48_14705, partial [Flavobacteriales bacterium]|nr:hypothetical protein [Flavobacteriales bacterium]